MRRENLCFITKCLLFLGHMNTTTYNEATNTASIGPGSTWGAVYTTLKDGWNVTAVGGRSAVVGIGGFVTGGGVSMLTSGFFSSYRNLILNILTAVLLPQQCPRLRL